MGLNLVFDIETDGLLDELTTMHSLVIRNVDTDAMLSCTDNSLQHFSLQCGLDHLQTADRIYAHNAIGFDIPAIQKLYPGWEPKARVMDTLIVAAMRWAHQSDLDFKLNAQGKLPGNLIGRHSLEAWGHRLGLHKGNYKDWSQWTPEMQTYCEQDTAVLRQLVLRIRKAGVSPESVETEQELAEYLRRQEQNGWPFDMDRARELHTELIGRKHELSAELAGVFPPWDISLGLFTPKVNNKSRGYVKGEPLERFKTIVFNPGSTHHIADRLTALYGWRPTEFTPSGLPKVDETTLTGLDYEPVKKLQEYLTIAKRLGQLSEGKEGWLRHVKSDGPRGGELTGLAHIHGRVLQNRTITHRAAHSNPNIAQVPKVGSPYGAECRELFHVPKGWVQIGADAAGLELRCLAHYMAKYDDGEYGKGVLAEKPDDVHTRNAGVLGLGRDDGKTWIYAFLYGAGDGKLGSISVPGASPEKQKAVGSKFRKKFLKGVPAMKMLVDGVKAQAKKRGYLHLIDGRRVYIRSEHAALNSLLQGTGAVICKRWIVEFNRRLVARFGQQGWDGKWAALGWIHDEVQLAVRPEIADEVQEILVDAIRSLTQHFSFRLPLDGEAKAGANWKDCH